jgi:tetratricopeptide (TPR) repeat protein
VSEKAIDSLSRAVEAANEIEHDEEKIRALCDIGNLFIDANRNDKAIETFDQARGFAELLDNIHRDFFLVNCALGFLYAGSNDLAERALDLVTDKTQMSSALLGFARDHWKKDEKEEALDTLDEAYEILRSQRDAETRDSRARNSLLASIATQFAGFGKTDRSVEIALENQDIGEQMAALSQIAQILTVQKEDDLARQTINLIAEDANRLFALVAVSDAKEKLGETDASLALLDEAATLAETVPQQSARSSILNGIAERFATHGQLEKARALSLENLNVISEIRDESSQAAALASLADIFDEANLELGEDEKQSLNVLVQKSEW